VELPPAPADGISYKANPGVDTTVRGVRVAAGETIDFVVDSVGDYEADDFQWAPVVKIGGREWDARKEFAGPPAPRLNGREQLAQVLLLTNEFAFLD
jgi:hypothetical protein